MARAQPVAGADGGPPVEISTRGIDAAAVDCKLFWPSHLQARARREEAIAMLESIVGTPEEEALRRLFVADLHLQLGRVSEARTNCTAFLASGGGSLPPERDCLYLATYARFFLAEIVRREGGVLDGAPSLSERSRRHGGRRACRRLFAWRHKRGKPLLGAGDVRGRWFLAVSMQRAALWAI